ncbi:hypothetical protein EVG20_g1729 [Dentipellis fragilis]|uniref:DNA-(apurinic or apyrimidinic site) endonuclease n=1 Tax=Dentipellis fragilis TaxID=205917 RepID=A0A4Y9Z9Y7_9AGAM|nr:hypothetical protein EVG20_g1729 [Dentipellis fragilis]
MRILSWNINGVRTIPHYHPWTTCKDWDAILKELKAEIICFQEMKTSRTAVGRAVALPESFDAFLSFPISRGGYSGVAVYTDAAKITPLKAEEGLSGKIQPKPPLTPEERVSRSYPYAHEIELMPDAEGNTPSDLSTLDCEGRGLVLDFGLFVLINLYCPNETSDERLPFKMNYHLMLQERVRKLVEEEKREVIVLGDMNICATPLDHCDGHLPSNASTFYDHPARAWFHKWLEPNGYMIDIVRKHWPGRKGMYTCWNTKISARETNYGTRVDYILITPGLLPWVKHGDIDPSIKGSDHCPIYIDLHEEITLESGEKLSLRQALRMDGDKRDPPRIATKFWEEHLRKQTLLSSFFGKGGAKLPSEVPISSIPAFAPDAPLDPAAPPATQSSLSAAFDALESSIPPDIAGTENTGSVDISPTPDITCPISEADLPPATQTSTAPRSSSPIPSGSQPTPPLRRSTNFRRPAQEQHKRRRSTGAAGPSSSKKLKAGQTKLSNFFAKPKAGKRTPEAIEISDTDDGPSSSQAKPPTSSPSITTIDDEQAQIEADLRLAQELSASQTPSELESISSSQGKDASQSKDAWSTLFARVPPPNCIVHGEPTKEYRVNKPGPNKGKVFYTCSRPVGPGYDKGRSERLRDEIDHQYKCNYFKWASDVKRESLRTSGSKKP